MNSGVWILPQKSPRRTWRLDSGFWIMRQIFSLPGRFSAALAALADFQASRNLLADFQIDNLKICAVNELGASRIPGSSRFRRGFVWAAGTWSFSFFCSRIQNPEPKIQNPKSKRREPRAIDSAPRACPCDSGNLDSGFWILPDLDSGFWILPDCNSTIKGGGTVLLRHMVRTRA